MKSGVSADNAGCFSAASRVTIAKKAAIEPLIVFISMAGLALVLLYARWAGDAGGGFYHLCPGGGGDVRAGEKTQQNSHACPADFRRRRPDFPRFYPDTPVLIRDRRRRSPWRCRC